MNMDAYEIIGITQAEQDCTRLIFPYTAPGLVKTVPCRPNKKNSTVKTDQNQLNKKSTHQKSIHQNVNFTTFELNKSQLNK